jgi:endonuclease YncB( thermonuclease family)
MTNIIPLKKRPDRGLRLLLLLMALLILGLAIAYWTQRAAIPTNMIPPGAIRVVDGDTIRTKDFVYRLVGFDAPETYDAKCSQERALGERAAARLKMIVDRGNLDLTEVRSDREVHEAVRLGLTGSIRLLPCYSSGIGAQRWTAYCIGSALRWSC